MQTTPKRPIMRSNSADRMNCLSILDVEDGNDAKAIFGHVVLCSADNPRP